MPRKSPMVAGAFHHNVLAMVIGLAGVPDNNYQASFHEMKTVDDIKKMISNKTGKSRKDFYLEVKHSDGSWAWVNNKQIVGLLPHDPVSGDLISVRTRPRFFWRRDQDQQAATFHVSV